jgi:hypothetical protein
MRIGSTTQQSSMPLPNGQAVAPLVNASNQEQLLAMAFSSGE